MQLLRVLRCLEQREDLLAALSMAQIEHFIALCRHLKPRIALQLCDVDTPPQTLPLSVHSFICEATKAPSDCIKLCWLALKEHVWELDACDANPSVYLPLFYEYGLRHNIAYCELLPPVLTCLNVQCQLMDPLTGVTSGRGLSNEYPHHATLFSHNLGPVPVWTSSYWCPDCRTRYYHNYYVTRGSDGPAQRIYYDTDVPASIQISDNFFVTRELCEWIRNQMVCGWVSGSNNARIYNELHPAPKLPFEWPYRLEIEYHDVWDAFFLHALLVHHHERAITLELADDAPSQAERLRPALESRNVAMVGPGQQDWAHACSLCCKLFKREDGSLGCIRSFVTDGITMGHPACGVHNCQESLPNNRSRFCTTHAASAVLCSALIDGKQCTNQRVGSFRTCQLPAHRELEQRYTERGRAMFQLKKRLETLSLSQTHRAVSSTAERLPDEGHGADSDEEVQADDLCNGKPETGNRKLRAKFGRNRTHNEELCVGSCGVIIGRATMFGSEAPSAVLEFWKCLFPTPASLPQCLWHDNNCSIMKMLKSRGDPYFDNVALPVDVFHFKCKHKESDIFCGEHCNPANWADLQVDGKWAFNSSAAEQANAWIGGFRAIVREMRPDRYNFFLDEMIKQRNRMIIQQLAEKGMEPFELDRNALLNA